MLIISKFHDFYDPVLRQTGVDKSIIYKRNTEEIKPFTSFCIAKHGNTIGYSPYLNKSVTSSGRISGIIFCGKFYPYLVLDQYNNYVLSQKITYDIKEIEAYIKQRKYKPEDSLSYLDQLRKEDFIDLHRQYNVPVISFDFRYNDYLKCLVESSFVGFLNPNLKHYQFYKVKHPIEAFQELSMYISGVLGINEDKPNNQTNKQKVQSHGFDKYSFRKDPTKNKK